MHKIKILLLNLWDYLNCLVGNHDFLCIEVDQVKKLETYKCSVCKKKKTVKTK